MQRGNETSRALSGWSYAFMYVFYPLRSARVGIGERYNAARWQLPIVLQGVPASSLRLALRFLPVSLSQKGALEGTKLSCRSRRERTKGTTKLRGNAEELTRWAP